MWLGPSPFNYEATQALAAAAHFLEFDGLLVPSARHPSANLIIFMDRDAAASLHVKHADPVDWSAWRKVNLETALGRRSGQLTRSMSAIAAVGFRSLAPLMT